MTIFTKAQIENQHAAFRLARMPLDRLVSLESAMRDAAPFAANAMNRRDSEALAAACRNEITRRFQIA